VLKEGGMSWAKYTSIRVTLLGLRACNWAEPVYRPGGLM
jgi:hypothetical protein